MTIAGPFFASCPADAGGREYVINLPEGASDAEINRARDTAKEHRKREPLDTIVIALPSRLVLHAPLLLDDSDSGKSDAPLIFRGNRLNGSILTGAASLSAAPINPDTSLLSTKFAPEARTKIWMARAESVLPRVSPAFDRTLYSRESLGGNLSVFLGRKRLEPSRWPATGYASTSVTEAVGSFQTLTALTNVPSIAAARDLWVAGYWGRDWWYESIQARATPNGAIQIPKLYSPFLDKARVYLFNYAYGLQSPGFYYFSLADRAIYFIPSETSGAEVSLSIPVARNIVKLRNASHIVFEFVAFERSIDAAVVLENTHDVTLTQCAVRQTGGNGIVVGGHDNHIDRCVIDETGLSGVVLGGGDAQTLTAGNNILRWSRISRPGRRIPAYRPAVRLTGVGNRIDHCTLVDGPHSAIIVEGSDHVISANDIGDFVQDTSDAGAIYLGMHATWRGTKISSNFIHGIHDRVGEGPAIGVYLDDQSSGQTIEGNVFRDVDLPILIGGGRNNSVKENFFFNSAAGRAPIFVDARGLSQQAALWQPTGRLRLELEQVLRESNVYARRYPDLTNTLRDRPGAPIGNRIEHNFGSQAQVVTYINGDIRALGTDVGNVTLAGDHGAFPDHFVIEPLPLSDFPALARTPIEIQFSRRADLIFMRNSLTK